MSDQTPAPIPIFIRRDGLPVNSGGSPSISTVTTAIITRRDGMPVDEGGGTVWEPSK